MLTGERRIGQELMHLSQWMQAVVSWTAHMASEKASRPDCWRMTG